MTDLVEFLEARLDNEDRTAWAAVQVGPVEDGRAMRRAAEAKRGILELHWPVDDGSGIRLVCPTCSRPDGHENLLLPSPCPTLRFFSLLYADHPDYRPEWSPDAS